MKSCKTANNIFTYFQFFASKIPFAPQLNNKIAIFFNLNVTLLPRKTIFWQLPKNRPTKTNKNGTKLTNKKHEWKKHANKHKWKKHTNNRKAQDQTA